MVKFDVFSFKRRVANTFSDRKLYELWEEVSSLYESEMISLENFEKAKRELKQRMTILCGLRRQLNKVFA